LVDALTPFAYRQLLAQVSPSAMAARLERVGVDVAELAADLPDQLHRLLGILASGGFEVHLRAAELQPLMARSERVANRVAVSVLAAAVFDGTARLLAQSPRTRRLPKVLAIVGGAGFLNARAVHRRASARRRSRAVGG
jgi:ubiquinone biosynthesis protein